MARLLAVFRRDRADAPGSAPVPQARRRAAPAPGELRRERRALLRAREERIRDLGGVVLEMYRQDSFRETLLYELCAEVAAMEERLRQLDLMLEARRPPIARCECGGPLLSGARFCASCGRPVGSVAQPREA
jgi:hypothetical protein